MEKPRITKEDLAQGLAELQVGQGLEAKFYKTGGVVVVTFECMADADGRPETTFRMGRKSQLRHSFADVNDVWNILTIDNGLEPPKELVPIAVPEKIRTKTPKPFVGCEEMKGVLTEEQAKKIATMMLYAAEYESMWIKWPALVIGKYGDENIQMITSAIVSLLAELGVELDIPDSMVLSKQLCQYGAVGIFVGDNIGKMREKYSAAPIYTDRRMQRLTLYRGVWWNGSEKKINITYVDAYQPTGEYADKEKIDKMIMRREKEWERYYEDERVNAAKEKAYRDAERRVEDYEQRKDTFCHGIGQRRVKLFLNACIKAGDEVAQMYRLALEAEGVNLNAKKALKKYHSDYHAYDKKEECLRQLSDMCKRMSVVFGIQASTAPAARYVVYYELPGCEQVSFHTNEPKAAGWPKYDGAWDGKKCSTLGKLENAIWQRYESELTKKYLND